MGAIPSGRPLEDGSRLSNGGQPRLPWSSHRTAVLLEGLREGPTMCVRGAFIGSVRVNASAPIERKCGG